MNEYFLHYLWKYQLTENVTTVSGKPVRVVQAGISNPDAGPDFINAMIYIGEQLWAGNVEIHLRSSDWYVHGHESDRAYDNVILHVVWDYDVDVFHKDNRPVDTLELQGKVPRYLLDRYKRLQRQPKRSIACAGMAEEWDGEVLTPWLERLYVERLEQKLHVPEALLYDSKNDWEAVLFYMLMRNFGLKVNGETFYRISRSLGYQVVRQVLRQRDENGLEAILLGQAGLLEEERDEYQAQLREKYRFYRRKFQLPAAIHVHFFRLRPPNFPTLRLAQLADLYTRYASLFQSLIKESTVEQTYALLECRASAYWDTHYHFGTQSGKRVKKISASFKNLLLINTVLPLRYHYHKSLGKDISERLFAGLRQIPAEKNHVIEKFRQAGIVASNALDTQALLQLKTGYCDRNKCLDCTIGWRILRGKEKSE